MSDVDLTFESELLDGMPVAWQATMRDSVTILRTPLLDDGAGGQYPDPSGPEEIGPICSTFWALSGRELIVASQLGQHGAYRLALEAETAIEATDQIVYQGTTYAVVWAPPLGALSLSRIVGLEEA